jgi:Tat protein translocase TatB subunit
MPSTLGPAEILVILIVALIVLGPTRLPQAGRQVGRALAEVRRWTRDVQTEVRSAFEVDERPPSYSDPIPTTPDWRREAPTAPIEPMPDDPVVPQPAATPGPTGEATPEPVVPVVDVPPAGAERAAGPEAPAPDGEETPPAARG